MKRHLAWIIPTLFVAIVVSATVLSAVVTGDLATERDTLASERATLASERAALATQVDASERRAAGLEVQLRSAEVRTQALESQARVALALIDSDRLTPACRGALEPVRKGFGDLGITRAPTRPGAVQEVDLAVALEAVLATVAPSTRTRCAKLLGQLDALVAAAQANPPSEAARARLRELAARKDCPTELEREIPFDVLVTVRRHIAALAALLDPDGVAWRLQLVRAHAHDWLWIDARSDEVTKDILHDSRQALDAFAKVLKRLPRADEARHASLRDELRASAGHAFTRAGDGHEPRSPEHGELYCRAADYFALAGATGDEADRAKRLCKTSGRGRLPP